MGRQHLDILPLALLPHLQEAQIIADDPDALLLGGVRKVLRSCKELERLDVPLFSSINSSASSASLESLRISQFPISSRRLVLGGFPRLKEFVCPCFLFDEPRGSAVVVERNAHTLAALPAAKWDESLWLSRYASVEQVRALLPLAGTIGVARVRTLYLDDLHLVGSSMIASLTDVDGLQKMSSSMIAPLAEVFPSCSDLQLGSSVQTFEDLSACVLQAVLRFHHLERLTLCLSLIDFDLKGVGLFDAPTQQPNDMLLAALTAFAVSKGGERRLDVRCLYLFFNNHGSSAHRMFVKLQASLTTVLDALGSPSCVTLRWV